MGKANKRSELNPVREMIATYIIENPGAVQNDIVKYVSDKTGTRISNGNTTHHLRKLEGDRRIKSVKYDGFRKYYPRMFNI